MGLNSVPWFAARDRRTRVAAVRDRAAAGNWLFVAGSTLAVIVIAAIPFLVVAWIVAAVRQYFS
jgi:hypothetical protein